MKSSLITQTDKLCYYYGVACGTCIGMVIGAAWFVLWLKYGVIYL